MSAPGDSNPASCPDLVRASTFLPQKKDVDGRDKPGHDGIGKRRRFRIAAASFAIVAAISAALGAWVVSLGPLPLAQAGDVSTTIVDRNGKLVGKDRQPSRRQTDERDG